MCKCPPHPVRAPTLHARLLSEVDIFLTLLKFWYPVWTSLSSGQFPTTHIRLPSSADRLLTPVRLRRPTVGYHPTQMPSSPQCFVPQAGSSIHFISLRFQYQTTTPHPGSNSPCWAISPPRGHLPLYDTSGHLLRGTRASCYAVWMYTLLGLIYWLLN